MSITTLSMGRADSSLFCHFRVKVTIFVGAKHSCHKLGINAETPIQECFAQSLTASPRHF